MFLSIVIPTYNRAHLIENTLKSVLDQTCQDFEVIIVDDGSSDNTNEVLQPYLSDKVKYFKVVNGERGAARNYGTKQAIGNYVNWFDSDDEMLTNHVEEILKTVTPNQPEVVTFHYEVKNLKSETITSVPFTLDLHSKKHPLIKGNCLSCNGVVVRRDIALSNPFEEDRSLSASEDYELWLRLFSKYDFINSSIVTTYVIQHDERSVVTMTNPETLEKRFLCFLNYCWHNELLRKKLGKDISYFFMRNYLILAVDLAHNLHKRKAFKYLIKAAKNHPKALTQKVFWATLKHLCLKYD